MKSKLLKYGIMAVLATYFLLAGTGWNQIRFCCAECKHAGIEQVASRSCEAIHHHAADAHHAEQHSHDLACTNMRHHTEGCCHLLRLMLSDTRMEHEQHIPPAAEHQALSDLPAFDTARALSAPAPQETNTTGIPIAPPAAPMAHAYLPQLCVWII